ncbi:MAG TPA: hypothetical protein VIL35_06955 [Vicinamibacterales bacterium]
MPALSTPVAAGALDCMAVTLPATPRGSCAFEAASFAARHSLPPEEGAGAANVMQAIRTDRVQHELAIGTPPCGMRPTIEFGGVLVQ